MVNQVLYVLEVQSQPGVVLLNESPGSLLHGLSPDTTLYNSSKV